MSSKKWTEEEDEKLETYTKQLKCKHEISHLIEGRTPESIYSRIKKRGLQLDINTLTSEQMYEIYKQTLGEFRKCMPNGFYSGEDGKFRLREVFKRFVNDHFDNLDEIKEKMSDNYCKDYRFGGAFLETNYSMYQLLIECFPEHNIKPWELKKSSVKWNEETMSMCKRWSIEKLKKDGIESDIYIMLNANNTKHWMNYFGMHGLVASKFDGSAIKWLEWMLDQTFKKEKLLELKYSFEEERYINHDALYKNGIIYNISDEYYKLDGIGIALMNAIIRYCEINNKFPSEHDLREGEFISSSQYRKYFKSDSIINKIRRYVNEIKWVDFNKRYKYEDNPGIIVKIRKTKICSVCNEELTSEYFSSHGTKCTNCKRNYENNLSSVAYYREKDIHIESITSLSPVEWYEYFIEKSMKKMPSHVYNKENLREIIRHVVLNKMKFDKSDILYGYLKLEELSKYRLGSVANTIFESINDLINYCLGDVIGYELEGNKFSYCVTNEDSILVCLDKFVQNKRLGLKDILNLKSKGKDHDWTVISGIHRKCFDGFQVMWVWYLEKKGYFNEDMNRLYHEIDFKWKRDGFWHIKENRIMAIREYCEKTCAENINNFMTTNGLKYWTHTYFNRDSIQEVINCWYFEHSKNLYGSLVEAYPSILSDKIMFEWEWNQCGNVEESFLVNSLREFILYRCEFKNLTKDIPRNICDAFVRQREPKLCKHIQRNRFDNWYEWSIKSFPEFKDIWNIEDFYSAVAYDGTIYDSKEEMLVYESLKKVFTNIEYIGRIKSKTSDHVFQIEMDDMCRSVHPDFYISTDGRPLYIEYYGMYNESNNYHVIKEYVRKTNIKNKAYLSNESVRFVGIYPEDFKTDKLENIIKQINDILKEENNE